MQAFFYDWIDRNSAKTGKKPLPDKIGSMQYFLHGFTGRIREYDFQTLNVPNCLAADASDFLRKHPWPGRAISDTFDDANHRKGGFTKKFMAAMKVICGRTGQEDELFDDDDDTEEQTVIFNHDHVSDRPFYWTRQLQNSFRQELEK